MATIVQASQGLEYRKTINVPVSGGTAVPATGTNEYGVHRLDRRVRFREFSIFGQQTITSGHPATNYMTVQLWNVTKATKMAQGTVVGAGANPGTISLNRLAVAQIATLNQFIGQYAVASAQDVLSLRFTATVTLNRGLTRPVVELVGDIID